MATKNYDDVGVRKIAILAANDLHKVLTGKNSTYDNVKQLSEILDKEFSGRGYNLYLHQVMRDTFKARGFPCTDTDVLYEKTREIAKRLAEVPGTSLDDLDSRAELTSLKLTCDAIAEKSLKNSVLMGVKVL